MESYKVIGPKIEMVGLSSEALRSQFIEYQTLSGGF